MRTREEIAWAAGFFEGEGCISPRRDGTITVSIGQNWENVESLRRFCDALGIGSLYGPYVRTGYRPYGQVHLHSFEYAQAVIAMLWPWLSRSRKDQYVLAFRQNRIHCGRTRRRGLRRHEREERVCAALPGRQCSPNMFVAWRPRLLDFDRRRVGRTSPLVMA